MLCYIIWYDIIWGLSLLRLHFRARGCKIFLASGPWAQQQRGKNRGEDSGGVRASGAAFWIYTPPGAGELLAFRCIKIQRFVTRDNWRTPVFGYRGVRIYIQKLNMHRYVTRAYLPTMTQQDFYDPRKPNLEPTRRLC